MDIHNLDCFEYFKKVADNSINLFVLDLPYTTTNWGKTTACKWDTPIDLEKMWVEIKRIMKRNAVIIFFCNTKFGFNLIQSNQKWFKYDLIWKKSRKVGFLSANKMPLRQHENIYIFKKECGTYNPQMEEGEPYNSVRNHDGKKEWGVYNQPTKGQINKGTRHPTSVLEMGEDSENIYIFKKEGGTYNSQLEEGEPHNRHKYKGHNTTDTYYNVSLPFNVKENKGTRHPTSILEMGEDSENIYIFKKEGGTYNSQKNQLLEPLKVSRSRKKDCIYGKLKHEKGGVYTDEHPTSVLEMGEDSENIYIFKKEGGTYNSQLEEGEDNKRDWTKTKERKLGAEIYDKDNSIKHKPQNNNGTRHPTSVLEMGEDSENIYIFKKDIVDKERHTYNSQKTPLDKPNVVRRTTNNYGGIYENQYAKNRTHKQTYTDEHPTNILEYDNPSKSLHKTQKPTDLLEWLIKSYSNEGDLVCDFTFGSGSTAIACLNTKRRFTGCERDEDIFKSAKKRIEEHDVEQYLLQEEERKQKKIRARIRQYKKFIEKHTKNDKTNQKKKKKNEKCV